MKNENLRNLSKQYRLKSSGNQNKDHFHTIKVEDLDICYRNFYSEPKMVDFEKRLCKEFDYCDLESLEIFEDFLER